MTSKGEYIAILYNYGYPKDFLKKLKVKELEFMIKEHSKKEVSGAGFIDELFNRGFQKVSNSVRSKAIKQEPNRGIRMLEKGEHHISMYDPVNKRYAATNYAGPGTRIDLHPNAPATSFTDAVAKVHDFEYLEAGKEPNPNKRAELIRAADRKMKEALRSMPYANHEIEKYLSLAGIEAKNKVEDVVPFSDKLINEKYYGRVK